MMMINSNSFETEIDKHHCHSKQYDDINNNHQYNLEKTLYDHCENSMKSNVLSLNDNQNQNQTIVEVQLETTKTSTRKRKLNLINNDQPVKTSTITTKKKKNSSMTKNDYNQTNTNTFDQAISTDESAFGSCEPGTNVVLQGIVWNETDKGVLVVNITWRGKTYVGALLNTTEQNWAPPRYKPEIRSTKSISNREQQQQQQQFPILPSIHESTERILRNGKRRGSNTTVTPNSTTKTRSFKIPETPKIDEEKGTVVTTSINSTGADDELGDNSSSRSVSPTTSGLSTTSSSPTPLTTNQEHSSTSVPMDLPNSSSTTNSVIPYHFSNPIFFPSSTTNSFNLSTFNKPPPYLPTSPQIYINSLSSSSSH